MGSSTSQCWGLGIGWKVLTLEVLIRLALGLASVLLMILAHPVTRVTLPHEWDDHAYPYKPRATFPEALTAGIEGGVFILCLVFWLLVLRFFKKWSGRRLVREFIYAVFSFHLAVLITLLVTEVIKLMYGRLRPDFLSRCYGNDRSAWPSNYRDIQIPICHASSASVIGNGRKSFPSGHSSMTWSGFLWIALYSYAKSTIFANSGGLRLAGPTAILMLPIVISVSRTSDYAHFGSDVLGGLFIAVVVTWVSFVFYHPLELLPVDKHRVRDFAPAITVAVDEDECEDGRDGREGASLTATKSEV